MISSSQIGVRRTARLGVLVALAALAGCGGGDASKAATTPASTTPAHAKPAAKPAPSPLRRPRLRRQAGWRPAAQDAAAVDPEVAAAIKDVQLPTQAEADAAAAQAITDANADAEFEKLQKELEGAEPPK
jgi:hypothetical protein